MTDVSERTEPAATAVATGVTAAPASPDARWFGEVVALFVVYLVGALLSQQLSSVGHGVAVMWFSSGLAAVLVRRASLWPAVFIASVVADGMVGTPFLALLAIGAGNTLE